MDPHQDKHDSHLLDQVEVTALFCAESKTVLGSLPPLRVIVLSVLRRNSGEKQKQNPEM